MEEPRKTTVIGLIVNICLLIIKSIASLMTGSIAIISDTINSFLDVLSSIATHIAVSISKRQADKGYPYGYKRAEPIAALLTAFLAAILAFEIFRSAITALITGTGMHVAVTWVPVVIMFVAIVAKIILSNYYHRVGIQYESPALLASSTDFKNDILASAIALIGLIGSSLHSRRSHILRRISNWNKELGLFNGQKSRRSNAL